MPTIASQELYLNSLKSKHKDLCSSIVTMLSVIVEDGADGKENLIQATRAKASDLASLLSPGDIPGWLKSVIDILSSPRQHYSRAQLLNDLIPILGVIYSYSWNDISDGVDGIDFDEIYTRHKQKGKIEDLFNNIIEQLQKIIDSGEIDSIKTLNALEKLIATLKQSKSGSYMSMMAGWGFLQALLKNWIFEQLKSIPVLGPILSALDATVNEMETEMETMHGAMHDEIRQRYSTDIPTLSYNQNAQTINSSHQSIADTLA